MKIYITRHGQVTPKVYENSVDYPTGDIPLTSLGQEQAICLGKELRARNFKGRIISSPYRRTMMTADLAANECGAPVYADGALREMFFSEENANAFNGMDIETLKLNFSHVAKDAILPYPWWTTCVDEQLDIIARLKSFWATLLTAGCEEVLVVGHGASVFGSMFFFNKTFKLGLPDDPGELGDFQASLNLNCNLSCIEINQEGKLTSARLFATDHLPDSLLTSNTNPKPRPQEVLI